MFTLRLLLLTATFISISYASQYGREPWCRHQSVMHMGPQPTHVNLLPRDLLVQSLDINGFNELRRNTNLLSIVHTQERSPLMVRKVVDESYIEYESYLKETMHHAAIASQIKYMESKKGQLLELLFADCKKGLAELTEQGLDK